MAMDRNGNLRRRTEALLERGDGDTERLATEWAMPFIPEDNSTSPTDIPFTTARRPQRPVSGCVTFFGRILMIFGLVVLLGGVYAGFNMLTREAHRTTPPQVYAVSGVPTVRIDSSIGRVDVVAGTSDKVEVVADVDVRHISQGLADQAVDSYNLEVDDSTPGTIAIHASERNPFDGDDIFAGWLAHRSVSLTVTIPANSNVEFNIAAGVMDIEGITGRVTGALHLGSVSLIGMNLANGSSFNVNGGHLFVNGTLQPESRLDVQVNLGNVELELPKTTDAYLNASASAGNVSADGWPGVTFTRTGKDDSTTVRGYLSSNTATKSRINITVNAGNASVNARAERTFDIERPSLPSLVPFPSAPPAPSR
ncbi:MAG: hypothetical protein U0841_31925 [Chloroflexia bacterium]